LFFFVFFFFLPAPEAPGPPNLVALARETHRRLRRVNDAPPNAASAIPGSKPERPIFFFLFFKTTERRDCPPAGGGDLRLKRRCCQTLWRQDERAPFGGHSRTGGRARAMRAGRVWRKWLSVFRAVDGCSHQFAPPFLRAGWDLILGLRHGQSSPKIRGPRGFLDRPSAFFGGPPARRWRNACAFFRRNPEVGFSLPRCWPPAPRVP